MHRIVRPFSDRRISQMALVSLLAGLLATGLALAEPKNASATGPAEGTVSFIDDVWPILDEACVRCHGVKEDFSNLRLDSKEGIEKGGDLGAVLVPGKPDESSLYLRVALPDDDLDLMPVEGDRLDEDQQEILRQWIEEGADFGGWTAAE